MKKIVISIGIIIGMILAVIALAIPASNSEDKQASQDAIEADVVMPTKVSRPGCQETDSCYVPTIISVKEGQTITWKNEDVAFHSVTSGFYGNPTKLFDSGHLDPEEKFSFTFNERGSFDYFCTLHPWMAGKVIVE